MKSQAIAYANQFGRLEASAQQSLDRCYEDMMRAFAARSHLVKAFVLIEHDTESSEYTWPDDMVRLDYVFYETRQLAETYAKVLQQSNDAWRDYLGKPVAYVVDVDEMAHIRLFPKPDQPSGPLTFDNGDPFGLDYPTNILVLCGSFVLRQDLPALVIMPATWYALSRQFKLDTPHQDHQFAQACEALATMAEYLISS